MSQPVVQILHIPFFAQGVVVSSIEINNSMFVSMFRLLVYLHHLCFLENSYWISELLTLPFLVWKHKKCYFLNTCKLCIYHGRLNHSGRLGSHLRQQKTMDAAAGNVGLVCCTRFACCHHHDLGSQSCKEPILPHQKQNPASFLSFYHTPSQDGE